MILRRLAEAIRTQSWFTVVIEVLVVVVGIFIGLQVDDWSKYRQDRVDEQHYLERLHEEMLNAEKLSARVLDRRITRLDVVLDILEAMPTDSERTGLTVLECETLSSMHFFNVAVSGLSAAEELTASGRMGILRDGDLRAALGALKQSHDATNTYIRIQSQIAYDLPGMYPDLIAMRAYYDTERGEVWGGAECDLPAMRQNQAFLNHFATNADVYDAYIRDGVLPWAEQMKRTHALIDRNLGLDH